MFSKSKIEKKKIKPLFKKKVVYLVSSPFSKRDFDRFGIENWIKSGWQVNVFDITSFLFPEYWRYSDGKNITYNFEGLKTFKNINEILFVLKNIKKKIIFIDYLQLTKTEFKIRKIAQAHGVLIRPKLGLYPTYEIERNIRDLFSLIKNPVTLTKKLGLFIKYKIQKIRENKYFPDYIIVGGNEGMRDINIKKISVIKAHNLDYDFLIKKKI